MTVANRRKTGVYVDHANREEHDFYKTPDCATEALLSVERFMGSIWEPACGDGAISRVLRKHGYRTISTDLIDRGYGKPGQDFLLAKSAMAPNVITNPPYRYATEFVVKALDLVPGKVAMLCRLAFLEGIERREIYDNTPLARVWVFSRRLTIYRRGIPTGEGGGTVAFAWFVWDKAHGGPPNLGWL